MHVLGRDPTSNCLPNASGDEAKQMNGRARNPYAARNGFNVNSGEETQCSPIGSPINPHCREGSGEYAVQPVNVQARYRLQSPPISFASGNPSFPTSPRDSALHSTPHVRSCSNSFPCDGFCRPNPSGQTFSPAMGRSPDFSNDPNMCMPPYPGGYTPSGFVMPPALATAAPPPRTDVMGRAPVPDGQASMRPKRPVSSPIACGHGSRYVSPVVLSVSPNYQVGSHPLCNPTGPQSVGCNNVHVAVGSVEPAQSAHSKMTTGDGSSTVSGGSGSSIREDLPLCSNDGVCTLINDRKHQRRFAHTCRLFPCYHGHIARHSKLFRHAPGQVAQSEELLNNGDGSKKLPAEALTSVSFSSISREAANAYRIIVSHRNKSYEIFGDWMNVRVHTFKRYLNQVYNVPPPSQVLVREEGNVPLDDDLESVGHYGIKQDGVVILRWKDEDEPLAVSLEQL
ncbi:uncharacterized protein TEOVI_000011400 [Trypanosoma equiperdum]|uniref:Ubiquitin-like domain-containing protein n=2 Tax=Trypanozoon TaxID=39700 RepID=Q57ZT8_TRYB2|nr:hypothetical protein, conserved [Trypanosoma brucei brucei TREU927]AAX79386.1 hypothetical protein, conserved [Trypanosoma brucei]AAZ11375.1 hypothetical protein, conserved [Trypanosoma brucei brucei TREU927]SCU64721.1 hypothetical protein, conserved [Trypanosoma equiperdum]